MCIPNSNVLAWTGNQIINLNSKMDIRIISNIKIMRQRMNAISTIVIYGDQAKRNVLS